MPFPSVPSALNVGLRGFVRNRRMPCQREAAIRTGREARRVVMAAQRIAEAEGRPWNGVRTEDLRQGALAGVRRLGPGNDELPVGQRRHDRIGRIDRRAVDEVLVLAERAVRVEDLDGDPVLRLPLRPCGHELSIRKRGHDGLRLVDVSSVHEAEFIAPLDGIRHVTLLALVRVGMTIASRSPAGTGLARTSGRAGVYGSAAACARTGATARWTGANSPRNLFLGMR